MSLRLYLIIMTLVSLGSWVGWLVVLNTIDPSKSGAIGFLLFFLTLGISFLATVTLVGTLVRMWIKQREMVVYKLVIRSLRQGLIFTGLFLAALLLSGLGLLVWWVLLLLIMISVVIELILLGPTETS